jgi:DNA-binding Xre family transcriptional regulator
LNIGTKIKKAMAIRGINDRELADRLGLTKQRVGAIKRSKALNSTTIVEVADALGYQVHELVRIDNLDQYEQMREQAKRLLEQEKDAMRQMEATE